MGTIDNAVGNTVVATLADGGVVETRLKPDGTFSRKQPDGSLVTGAWKQDGDTLHETVDGAAAARSIAANKNVGDTWQETDPQGRTMNVTIRAGQ